MPRKNRITGLYNHVIIRGNGQQIIFEENKDSLYFIKCMRECLEKCNLTIMAYCLMSNHVHMLIKDENGNLASYMKLLEQRYAQYFNLKNNRVGHVFQARYKCQVIEDDSYLISVYRYIMLNPTKAGICGPDKYGLSSFKEMGLIGGITDCSEIIELAGGEDALRECILNGQDDYLWNDNFAKDDKWYMSLIKKELGIQNLSKINNLNRNDRANAILKIKALNCSAARCSRLTGIPRQTINRIYSKSGQKRTCPQTAHFTTKWAETDLSPNCPL